MYINGKITEMWNKSGCGGLGFCEMLLWAWHAHHHSRELEKERLVSGSDVITDRSVYQMEIEKATHHDNPI
jgi:DNA-directed RNA polymerase beta subunit